MKKGIVLLLAAVLVFAFATTAYAANPDSWDPLGPTYRDPGAGDSPHGSYAATNDECEICHSPHQAGTGGASFRLLRATTQATACDYCHIAATGVASDWRVYQEGGVDVKTNVVGGHEIEAFTNIPDANVNYAIVGASLECYDCHTVHGAGALAGYTTVNTLVAPLANAAILKANANGVGGSAANIDQFCAECHDMNLNTTYGDSVNDNSHIMGAVADLNGSLITATSGASTHCSSCHVPTTITDYKWPHNSYGAGLINLDTDGTHNNSAPITRATMDANCLMCHDQVGTNY